MRALVQRVTSGRVEVDGRTVGQIGVGLVCFLGIAKADVDADVDLMLDRVVNLRIFEDERRKMARSLLDAGGGLLVVSQFTLYADTTRGRRPSFDGAMAPALARAMYDVFVDRARARVAEVATGVFGADMRVLVDNDGPVSIFLESRSG